MAYNYNDQIPEWKNEGSEPSSSTKETGFTPGYKPPADYFNWFWNKTLKWLRDLRDKLSSLHTKVESIENSVNDLKINGGTGGTTMTAAEILAAVITVDGANSGLDADLLDGKHASEFATTNHTHTGYAVSNHSHSVASASANGFMSSEMVEKLSKLDPAYLITLAERNKLATVEENANNYTHPSTHPASMISGLEAYLSDLGYGKSATGSYIGDGTGENKYHSTYGVAWGNSGSTYRTITLSFTPSVIMIFDTTNKTMSFALSENYGYESYTYSAGASNTGTKYAPVFYLTGNELRLVSKTFYGTSVSNYAKGPNQAGYTYQWIAF